jgi:starch phosphorylase
MNIRPFNVLPRLPETLEPLRTIAYNMWFSWNWEAVQLFIRLDAAYWETTYQNPALMLGVIPQERFEELARDEGFVATMNRVCERFKEYMDAPTWFSRTYPDARNKTIAYFSCEYGIDVGLPIYSGGLGVLAGDHLKSASDLGLPMVAVGLLYREGYLQQYLTADGWQREAYPKNDWYNMPVTMALDGNGKPIRGEVEIGNEMVQFLVWRVQVGRVPLYLLDTDLPENSPANRTITTRLYVGDRETRLKQEIVLGIGGMRALAAMGIEPAICHMNEGHSALMALERTRQIMERHKLSRAEAREVVWSSTVFTTHTPVPAGNERFAPDLMQRLLGQYLSKVSLDWNEFLAMGRENPSDGNEQFCLTVLALHYAAHNNGVSALHGKVSRGLWQSLWPALPADDIPIGSITNGIHTRSWLSHDMAELLDRYLGPRFLEEPMDFSLWKKVENIPDAELWRTHELRRERLIWFARKRLKEQAVRRGAPPYVVAEAEQLLDPEALTIGFARRFAEYKRGTLILTDPARLARLVNAAGKPVQFIIAGKSHPNDTPGKQVIKDLVHAIRADEFRKRIVFLEDYDINVARYLVQGADIWLNTPRPPLEASGTSGMKAVANGAIHVSTFDGWWCEGYGPDVGWVIGSGEAYDSPQEQDAVESGALYDILEREIIPLFYDREKDGLPRRWIAKAKRSMSHLGAYFNTHRMTSDYVRDYYLDAGKYFEALAGDGQARAKDLAAWRARLENSWNGIRVEAVQSNVDQTLSVGDRIEVQSVIRLGQLKPEDIEVQLCVGGFDGEGYIKDGLCGRMVADKDAKDGVFTYRASMPCTRSGRRAFAVRVIPHHEDLVHPFIPGKVIWG